MNLKELKVAEESVFQSLICKVEGKLPEDCKIPIGQEISGKIDLGNSNLFKLISNGFSELNSPFAAITISFDNKLDAAKISEMLKQKRHLLFQGKRIENIRFELYVVSIPHIERQDLDPLCVLEHIKHKNLSELKANFTLEVGGDTYIPYVKIKKTDTVSAETKEYTYHENIRLIGKNYNLDVTIGKDKDKDKDNVDELYILAERKISNKNYKGNVNLYKGSLTVVSEKEVTKKLVRNSSIKREYLELWKQYDEVEEKIKLQKVYELGCVKLNIKGRTEQYGQNGYCYIPVWKNKGYVIEKFKNEYIILSPNIPNYIANIEGDENGTDIRSIRMPKDSVLVRFISYEGGGIVVELPNDIENRKKALVLFQNHDTAYASLSLFGDITQMTRRKEARERIEQGESANPVLGFLFEGTLENELAGISQFGKNVYRDRKAPLSNKVKEKVFKEEPTHNQKKAIEIALNTPDIAIIQGPPGTGKTTVITAIVERLNELFDKRKIQSGRILLTSYQHDAINNVIERIQVNSLPIVKFGNEKIGDESVADKIVSQWCEEYEKKLIEQNPELKETDHSKLISQLYNQYVINPNNKNAIEFLKGAKKVTLQKEVLQSIAELEDSYHEYNKWSDTYTIDAEIVALIRRLRTTKEGFLDDGSHNARRLLFALEELDIDTSIESNKKIIEVLTEASHSFSPSDTLLDNIKSIKQFLLSAFIEKPIYIANEIDINITDIYENIKREVRAFSDTKKAVLHKMLEVIQTDRERVKNTLKNYLVAYASTTQQSEGYAIREAKSIKKRGEHPSYEVVIVDEAARIVPSDLMIPMAQAKEKIILVGDHRQLPHMYDAETFEKMKKNKGINISLEYIKRSFFEYLFDKAKELEKKDGCVRTITLDRQYRMHPLLGDFVSRNFYEPYGESFLSPLGEECFSQNLTEKDFPLVWYDIPPELGNAVKHNYSRKRDCEVQKIVDVIREYINSPQGNSYSYGVISFYSSQVKAIKEQIKDELGEDVADKILVGSVDAFQGREFDVIILSIVRTTANKSPSYNNSEITHKDIQQYLRDKNSFTEQQKKSWSTQLESIRSANYGFISEENRLCVALSRQKKLLTIVGDSTLFTENHWAELSEVCMPALKRLYELCKEEGVVIAHDQK